MSFSENEQEQVFKRRFTSTKRQGYNKANSRPQTPSSSTPSIHPETSGDEFSASVSWPILLAVIPAIGAFFAGSAEVWSDFIMILLTLYYVYKWLTVPWSYYQGTRSRRVMHQQSSELFKAGPMKDNETKAKEIKKRAIIAQELRRHEVAGLIWVTLSPAIAGYTLQYSRYLLSSVDKYISAFNVTVFILAASIRPLSHALTLLSERTLYLQSEMLVSETQVEQLQTKVDILEKELDSLRRAYATKKDLGQVTEDINPALQQLAKSLRRFEKRESVLKQWTEEQFSNIDFKVREFDQYICYAIEKEQRQQAHGMIVSLILLPLNISLWVAKRMTLLLPVYHSNLISASSTSPPAPSSNSKIHSTARPSKNLPPQVSVTSKQLTQAIHDPTESSYSTEGSLAAFGH